MIPYMVGKLAPNSSHLTRGLVKYIPGRGYSVPFPPKTGTNLLHPRPPQSLNESTARKKRALVLLQGHNMFEFNSVMWLSYNISDAHTMNRLAVDDTPTRVARRDVTNFFSPQDCFNFDVVCVVAYPLSFPPLSQHSNHKTYRYTDTSTLHRPRKQQDIIVVSLVGQLLHTVAGINGPPSTPSTVCTRKPADAHRST